MAKAGSTVSGFGDAWATAVSIALQYGAPLASVLGKFVHMRFEPAGFTGSEAHPIAQSIVDYVATWLAIELLTPDERAAIGVSSKAHGSGLSHSPILASVPRPVATTPSAPRPPATVPTPDPSGRTPDRPCPLCGSWDMALTGPCWTCRIDGTTTSCG